MHPSLTPLDTLAAELAPLLGSADRLVAHDAQRAAAALRSPVLTEALLAHARTVSDAFGLTKAIEHAHRGGAAPEALAALVAERQAAGGRRGLRPAYPRAARGAVAAGGGARWSSVDGGRWTDRGDRPRAVGPERRDIGTWDAAEAASDVPATDRGTRTGHGRVAPMGILARPGRAGASGAPPTPADPAQPLSTHERPGDDPVGRSGRKASRMRAVSRTSCGVADVVADVGAALWLVSWVQRELSWQIAVTVSRRTTPGTASAR